MSIVDAVYVPFPVEALKGNPLIEALRPPLPIDQFVERLTYRPALSEGDMLDDFSRELCVELIDFNYTVTPELFTLYRTILKNIIMGYLHRNPMTRETKHQQYLVATEQDYDFQRSQTKNLSKVVSVLGLSGAGKTLAIRNCLSLVPQTIRHNKYQGERFVAVQIVYLEFQAPVTRTTRGFILSFFIAVDELIKTNYYNQWKGKSTPIPNLIQEAKKVAFNHYIGLVFVDEVQRCASSNAKADYTTLEFIDDFFNSVGIPMVVAGTYKAMPLFRTTMSTTRRLSSSRKFTFDVFENDLVNLSSVDEGPSLWSIFIDSFYFPNLLHEEFEFDTALKEHIHYLTLGLPALTARLMRLTYEEAILSSEEKITVELLDAVYLDQFELLHPAIESLRKGQYGGYEDLLPPSAFKPSDEQRIEKIISDDIAYHERLTAKSAKDNGEYVEFADYDHSYIPAEDLRNLKGLSKEQLAQKLGAKK
ncbi:AAA family ATPase [Vibrio harveyi]|uniref:AAA family ATPase n=1 Tax=Vibrio harveyi TaxID=669 RepID=UPI0031BBA19A